MGLSPDFPDWLPRKGLPDIMQPALPQRIINADGEKQAESNG
jgi:hypothetical protein